MSHIKWYVFCKNSKHHLNGGKNNGTEEKIM
jgi:hypothetical protein